MIRHKVRRQRTRPNHERWLVSYADFITLLFAFFVVMFASSQGDQKKAARLSNAIEEAFEKLGVGQPGLGVHPLQAMQPDLIQAAHGSISHEPAETRNGEGRLTREMSADEIRILDQELEHSLASEVASKAVTVRSTPDGLVISLQELGFFESGSASLRANSRDTFARIAALLQKKKCKVRIEGHTDPMPIHTAQFDSNWELSTARATGLVKLLIQKYAYDPSYLAAGGYAEFHPIADNDTAEGRRANRRVDFVIVSAILPHFERKFSPPPGGRSSK